MAIFSRNLFLMALCLLVVLSCSRKQSTVLIDSWSDDILESPGFDKVLVVGIAPNPEGRKLFEEQMQKTLSKKGITALSWLQAFSPEDEVTEEAYFRVFGDQDIDGLILTRLLATGELPLTVPSNRNKRPPPELYDNFYNYYNHVKVNSKDPMVFESGTVVFLETNVYDTRNAKLVWAGQSKSFNMNKPNQVLKDISNVVTGVLVSEGILK